MREGDTSIVDMIGDTDRMTSDYDYTYIDIWTHDYTIEGIRMSIYFSIVVFKSLISFERLSIFP
jgi:hypothetical protein